jgi:hypothetical protein
VCGCIQQITTIAQRVAPSFSPPPSALHTANFSKVAEIPPFSPLSIMILVFFHPSILSARSTMLKKIWHKFNLEKKWYVHIAGTFRCHSEHLHNRISDEIERIENFFTIG